MRSALHFFPINFQYFMGVCLFFLMKDQNYFILTIPTGSNFSRNIVFSYLHLVFVDF